VEARNVRRDSFDDYLPQLSPEERQAFPLVVAGPVRLQ
jgi:hypothetical protein